MSSQPVAQLKPATAFSNPCTPCTTDMGKCFAGINRALSDIPVPLSGNAETERKTTSGLLQIISCSILFSPSDIYSAFSCSVASPIYSSMFKFEKRNIRSNSGGIKIATFDRALLIHGTVFVDQWSPLLSVTSMIESIIFSINVIKAWDILGKIR